MINPNFTNPAGQDEPVRAWHLHTRLALALILVFLPIAALMVFSHLQDLHERRDAKIESLKTIDETVAANVDGFARDLETFALSASITLGEASDASTPLNQATFGQYFQDLAGSYNVRAIFITDLSGQVLAGTTASSGFDLSSRDYIQALQNGATSFWSGAFAGSESGQTTLAYSRPVLNRDGRAVAYLVIAFYPPQLQDRLTSSLPDQATLSLIDNKGIVLYTSAANEPTTPTVDISTWPAFSTAQAGQPVLIKSGSTPLDAGKRYGAYVPVARTGWVAGLTVPASSVDAPLMGRFRRDVLIMAAVLTAGIVTMLFIAARLTQPMNRLAAAAAAISRGERPDVPQAAPDANVARLEAAMASMSDAIAERQERVESQSRVLQTLERVGEALATELDFKSAIASIGQAVIDLTGVDQAALFLKDQTTGNFELLGLSGIAQAFPLAPEDPLLQAVWRKETVYLPDVVALPGQRPGRFEDGSLHVRSLLGVPIVSRSGDIQGALFLLDSEPQALDEYDQRLAIGLTRRAAVVIENARLFSESQAIQERLREANQTKDEFLAVISHELRTPITTIYGGARLLQSRSASLPPEAKEEMIASIEEESERLYRLVEDLLAVARADLGEEPTMEPAQMVGLIDQITKQFGNRRPGRPVEVKVEGRPAPVLAESTYVRQIVTNLLTNADKYSETGLAIEVVIDGDEDENIVRVLDRGPGVPPNELDSIFDSFYRSRTTAKQAGGKGLGLTVCKRLVEAMSGRIWARLREGGGLEVGFALPNAPDLEAIAAKAATAEPAESAN